MRTCPECKGSGRIGGHGYLGGFDLHCTACGGRGEIGGDEPRPWIKTSGLWGGGVEIYDSRRFNPWPWPQLGEESQYKASINDLERRIARLETAQRRKPKRKAGRR